MKANLVQVLTEISRQTGLNRETVKDLLKKGWLYEETMNGPATWKHAVKR